jgi:hypothetical protein
MSGTKSITNANTYAAHMADAHMTFTKIIGSRGGIKEPLLAISGML